MQDYRSGNEQYSADDPLGEMISSGADAVRSVVPEYYDAIARFWSVPQEQDCLAPKVRELVMIALVGSVTTLDRNGIDRHVERAIEAGATPEEILDVLVSISPLGVHSFAVGLPVLLEEIEQAGGDAQLPPITEQADRKKQTFIQKRGYWTDQREMIARLMPDFFEAYLALSSAPWKSGSLEPKVREMVYIAIDCSVTHMYEHGLRIHIRNALKLGATRAEILHVFMLAATIGTNSYVAGAKALAKKLPGEGI